MDNIINQEVNKADAFCPKSKEDQYFATTAMNYVLQDDSEKLITEWRRSWLKYTSHHHSQKSPASKRISSTTLENQVEDENTSTRQDKDVI